MRDVAAFGLALCLAACASQHEGDSATDTTPRAGFVELAPLAVELGPADARVEDSSPRARLFYRFVPARDPKAAQRLCLLFNGGPGAGSELLWLNLGPGAKVQIATLCNALFLDARNTGLSYELVDDPDTHVPSVASYDAYLDAADALRALRYVWRELALEAIDEVVLFGESYGGVRASLMLDLAYDGGVASDRPFHAAALETELRELFALAGVDAAKLFRHAVLLEPDVAGRLQDQVTGELLQEAGSPLHQLADELGATLDPCDPSSCNVSRWAFDAVMALGRSPYDYTAPSDWFDRHIEEATQYGQSELPSELSAAGMIPKDLRAGERTSAFRFVDSTSVAADSSAWSERYGSLAIHDRYFVAYSREIAAAFESGDAQQLGVAGSNPAYGSAFVRAARQLSFFVTRAEHDLVGYPPALGATLERLPEISSATLESTADTRSGAWHLLYRDGSEARLRAASYVASHAVAADVPDQLLADISAWLERR